MPQAIVYCDRCNSIIPPGEQAGGEAIVGDRGGICASCAANLSPEQRAELHAKLTGQAPAAQPPQVPQPPQAPCPPHHPVAHHRTSARTAHAGRGGRLPLVGAVAGLSVGVAVAVIVVSGRGEPPTSASRPSPVSDGPREEQPKTPAAPPGESLSPPTDMAAQRRLAEVTGWADGLPERYREMREALAAFPRQFPGVPAVAEAKALLEKVDARFARHAEAELAKAVAEAKARAADEEAGDAKAALAALRERFGGTPWYETRGRKAMDAAQAELSRPAARPAATEEEKLLARAEEAFDGGEARTARGILDSTEWPEALGPRVADLRRRLPDEETVDAAPRTVATNVPAAIKATPYEDRLASLRKGLAGWWTFDEGAGRTVAESSGTGTSGTLRQMAGDATTWVAGKVGPGAIEFDGADDFVGLAGRPVAVQGNAARTIACWVRTTAGGYRNVIATGTCSGRRAFNLQLWRGVVGVMGFNNDFYPKNGTKVNDGAWHHIAAAYDGAGTIKTYVDGVMDNSAARSYDTMGQQNFIARSNHKDVWRWFKGAIDDVRIYRRALSDEELQLLFMAPEAEAMKLLPAGLRLEDVIGIPAKDGYSVGPAALAASREFRDAEKVTPRKIATVGDSIAASSSFDASLREELSVARGYAFSRSSSLASTGKTAAQIAKNAPPALARERPEVVRICLGLTDVVRQTDLQKYGESLDAIVKAVTEAGAVPVLCTLPALDLRPTGQNAKRQTVKAAKAFSDRIKALNATVRRIASERRVPCLDAHAIVNRDPASRAKFFTSRGGLKADAFRAVNASFLRLYGLIEFVVLGRGSAPGGTAAGGGVAATAVRIANGGFEEKNDRGYPAGWKKAQWGDRRAGSSVRLDKSNPHGGESALAVRALGDGSKPGASTTLRLDPGAYEISYWACAAVGKTATVGARFGGRELVAQNISDGWARLTETVRVEKKNLNAELGLWVSTTNVRVWFDDVEVRKMEGPDAP